MPPCPSPSAHALTCSFYKVRVSSGYSFDISRFVTQYSDIGMCLLIIQPTSVPGSHCFGRTTTSYIAYERLVILSAHLLGSVLQCPDRHMQMLYNVMCVTKSFYPGAQGSTLSANDFLKLFGHHMVF